MLHASAELEFLFARKTVCFVPSQSLSVNNLLSLKWTLPRNSSDTE